MSIKNALKQISKPAASPDKPLPVVEEKRIGQVKFIQFTHAVGPGAHNTLRSSEQIFIDVSATGITIEDTRTSDKWCVPFSSVVWYRLN